MSTLGATQLQVAEDGHALRAARAGDRRRPSTPGTTADTLVKMPTGPETKVTLFESGSHLDNDGQTELDPGKVATGGMLTFLDTGAPQPTDDHVGPTSAHIAVTPNPSDGKSAVTVTADLSDTRSGGSDVTAGELTVDDPDVAPGVRAAAGQPVVRSADGHRRDRDDPCRARRSGHVRRRATGAQLPVGRQAHRLRPGSTPSGNWGVVGSAVLNLPKTGPSTLAGAVDRQVTNGSSPLAVSATGDDSAADGTITDAEMFLDTAAADGTGLAMTLNRSGTVVSEDRGRPGHPGQRCHRPGRPRPRGPRAPTTSSSTARTPGVVGTGARHPVHAGPDGSHVDAAAVSPNPSNGRGLEPGQHRLRQGFRPGHRS